MKNDKKETIIFMEEEIEKAAMPHVYRLALNNPKNLEATIRRMMEKQGFTNPGSAMAILESDLG